MYYTPKDLLDRIIDPPAGSGSFLKGTIYMTHKQPNQVPFDGGMIVIQSCDAERANIGVFKIRQRSVYHHVSIPELAREWDVVHYSDMPSDEYDRIINAHKAEILQTVRQLNACVS